MDTKELVYLWEPDGSTPVERITCLHCNEILQHKQAFSRKVFCSPKCRSAYHRPDAGPVISRCVNVNPEDRASTSKDCPICGLEVKPPRTRYCSQKCYRKQNSQTTKKRPVHKPGRVYIAVSPHGYFKVGFTQRKSVESRIGRWLCGHPGPLDAIYYSDDSCKSIERRIILALEEHRIVGGGVEWFEIASLDKALGILGEFSTLNFQQT